MRALILIFMPALAWAEPPTLSLSTISTNRQGATQVGLLENQQNIGSRSLDIAASSGLLKNGFRLRAAATSQSRSVDDYIIVDEFGNESSLSESFDGNELSSSVGFDFVKASHTVGLDYSSTMNESPLERQQAKLTYTYSIYKLGSTFQAEQSRGRQKQPLSYFVNPDTFVTQAGATELNPVVTSLAYEQIVNERTKVKFQLNHGRRPEDRPDHQGYEARGAYAISDFVAVHLGYEQLGEDKSTALKDRRGHLSLKSYDFGLAFEPTYKLLILTSYSTSIETETGRGSTPEQIIGTDALDVSVDYRMKKLSLQGRFAFAKANTGLESNSLGGGVTWEM